MNDKIPLENIIKNFCVEDNLQYQKLITLPLFDLNKCNYMFKNNRIYYLLEIEFDGDVNYFNEYKSGIDFGKITMSKFLGKVDRALHIKVSIRIKKEKIESDFDILHSQDTRESHNKTKIKKLNTKGSGMIIPNPGGILKKLGGYSENIESEGPMKKFKII